MQVGGHTFTYGPSRHHSILTVATAGPPVLKDCAPVGVHDQQPIATAIVFRQHRVGAPTAINDLDAAEPLITQNAPDLLRSEAVVPMPATCGFSPMVRVDRDEPAAAAFKLHRRAESGKSEA